MKASLKWILKRQLGWIAGAIFILIYTSAASAQIVELSSGYRYTTPGTNVVTTSNPDLIRFNPAPKDDRPSQMDIAKILSSDLSRFGISDPPAARINKPIATPPVQAPTAPTTMEMPTTITPPTPIVSPKTTPAPTVDTSSATVSLPKTPEFFGSPVWGRSQEKDKWTRAVLSVVRANKKALDRAKDVETFCPGYRASSAKSQEMCWAIIISAISKKESEFNPATSFREPNGEYSVGLLAMSGHQCRNAPTIKALKNATENLKCGTGHMVKMINLGKCISCKPGGGSNWSVLRKPYRFYHPGLGKTLNLGKIGEILAMTKPKFKSVLRDEAKFKEQVRLANQTAPAPVEPAATETNSEVQLRKQEVLPQIRLSKGRS